MRTASLHDHQMESVTRMACRDEVLMASDAVSRAPGQVGGLTDRIWDIFSCKSSIIQKRRPHIGS